MNNAWIIETNEYNPSENRKEESIFTIANGNIGLRGDSEEMISTEFSKRGTFINGFYEKSTIPYGEVAYGYASHTQTMLNVSDAKQIYIEVEGQTFSLESSKMDSYRKYLDMKNGCLIREITWRVSDSIRVELKSRRIASMVRDDIAVIQYTFKVVGQDAKVKVKSVLDGSLKTGEESDDPRIAGGLGDGVFQVSSVDIIKNADKNILSIEQTAQNAGNIVRCFVINSFLLNENETFQVHDNCEDNKIIETFHIDAIDGKEYVLDKIICYKTNLEVDKEDLVFCGQQSVLEASILGADRLFKEQSDFYKKYWEKADIKISGNDYLTQSMRFNIFQLTQSVGKNSRTSIAAKGLSGEGYGGHYFWESESYILSVFMNTYPEVAKSLLEYRYSILDKAREQARLLGHEKGALYAWRSINGEECSAYFLGGSSQYHINADVAFGIARYMQSFEDDTFLVEKGLEILLETSRLWINVGHFNPRKNGQYCIECVTGPDEYTSLVDNNFYTNIMAREALKNTIKYGTYVRDNYPEQYAALVKKISFDEKEYDVFKKAADFMYLPYDDSLKIHKQDDTFLDRKDWDIKSIPVENHPLLTHYHPMYIYRHKVCKQADMLLAIYYLPQYFKMDDMIRDYNYYEAVTTHDSSLSACIYSIVAAAIGNKEKAYQYFIETIRTDLDDCQKNTKDGLHMANMAGAWMGIVHGFAGCRVIDGNLILQPVLPQEWNGYEFTIRHKGVVIFVEVCKEGTRYTLKEGKEIEFSHYDRLVTLNERVNNIFI